MPFTIVRQDITKMNVDAIVNAANTDLRMGGGVCGAIFYAAGAEELQKACEKLSPIETGQAVITPGFHLQAKYVIHAAGPVYSGWNARQCQNQLRSAYLESLSLAWQHQCESIAFPLISSGIYGYPKKEALQIAVSAIQDFLDQNDIDMDVYLVVFDKTALSVSEELQGAVRQYIDENYVESRLSSRRKLLEVEERALRNKDVPVDLPEVQHPKFSSKQPSFDKKTSESDSEQSLEDRQFAEYKDEAQPPSQEKTGSEYEVQRPLPDGEKPVCEATQQPLPVGEAPISGTARPLPGSLADQMKHLDEPFCTTLLQLIDSKGKTDAEVYKRANIDRRLFSKIRSGNGYLPGKRTILALAIALELSLAETDDLLERAGYALSHSQKFDVIIEFFIVNGIYDIFQINEVLFAYDQPLLGSK